MFDKMLVSKNAGIDKRRVKNMAASSVAHLAFVGLIVFASALAVEVVNDPRLVPDLLIDFVPTPPPPPPPPKPKVLAARVEPIPEPPKIEPPKPKPEPLKIEPPKLVKLDTATPEPEVQLPEKQLAQQKQALAVSKLDAALRARDLAPDVAITKNMPGRAGRPELSLNADQLKGAPGVTGSLDAPDTALGGVSGGKSTSPSSGPKLTADRASWSKTTLYGGQGGGDPEVNLPAGGPGGKGGGAPAGRPGLGLGAAGLGGNGGSIKYAAGPPDGGPGAGYAGSATHAGSSRLDAVRAALASKYGLPLVSVNDMGARSTDAARWNVLLPQITELLKQALHLSSWSGAGQIASVQRDGRTLVIRYRDGIVHVLTLGDDGFAALFVAAPAGARNVQSKVDEAEGARSALYSYLRGAQ